MVSLTGIVFHHRWGGDGPPIEILVSPEWCVIMAHLIRWGWRATRT